MTGRAFNSGPGQVANLLPQEAERSASGIWCGN